MENQLNVSRTAAVQQELGLQESAGTQLLENPPPEIDRQAEEFILSVMSINPSDPSQEELKSNNIQAVEMLGSTTQKEASHRSAMLREPIRKLSARGEDGGEVANALLDLKVQVEALDPGKFNLEAGWFSRTLGFIPGIGTPLKKYFTRFESSQTVIDAVLGSLNEGKKILQRDNVTLTQDQKAMRSLTLKLEKSIQLGMVIDNRLEYLLEREIPPDDPRRLFIQEELQFPLRQRIQELQQQLAVNQQGVLAVEIIIRNNKELIKGVDRGMNVTVNALNVAVTVALALANQKIVLDKIDAVNKVTNNLITQTAATLKTQGASIYKQAGSTQLDMDVLKTAFSHINEALEDISSFRREALPQMANSILEMENMSRITEDAIRKMEDGNRTSGSVILDVN